MDGTESLDHESYRAYHVICQLIYLNEGPIALNEHGIAGRCRMSIRTFRAALQDLLDKGKLTLSDGRLDNSRTKKELEKVSDNRVKAGKGGKKSGEVRNVPAKSLKAKDLSEAALQQDRSLKTREEETRVDMFSPVALATRTKNSYSEEFEAKFWQPYPRTPNMSKSEAWREWIKLKPEQQASACQAIEPYKRFLRTKPNLETVHACRFLSQRRFEGFQSQLNTPASEHMGSFV